MTFFKVIFGHLSYQIMVVGPLVVGLFILGTKQNLLPSEIISWNYLLPSWTHQPIRGQPGQCPPLWLLVQFSHSVMSDSLWPHGLQHSRPPCPGASSSRSLPKLVSIESVMPSNHLILCCPLLLLPSIFPRIRVFSNESVLHIRWLKYWSFSFSISPSDEYSGLISFRMDWLDLLAVHGTRKNLFQQHSSKTSILWRSAFFIVQLSHPYMTIGKAIALTRGTFVGKVMSLLFNMLSRVVITFLPRSKRLLIS